MSLCSCILTPKGAVQAPHPAPTEAGTRAPPIPHSVDAVTPWGRYSHHGHLPQEGPGVGEVPGLSGAPMETPEKGRVWGRVLVGNTGSQDERPGLGPGDLGKHSWTQGPHRKQPRWRPVSVSRAGPRSPPALGFCGGTRRTEMTTPPSPGDAAGKPKSNKLI